MRRWTWVVLLAACVASGCGTNGDAKGGGSTGADEADAGSSAPGDVSMDTAGSAMPDAGGEADGGGCELQSDCPDGMFCADSTCRQGRECVAPRQWKTCVEQIRGVDPKLAERAVCRNGRCQVACALDRHCPGDRVCTDDGHCRTFESALTGEHPGGESRGKLKAGVGEALMRFPIGLPLGGYGGRAGSLGGRYSESLRASHGQMSGLHARAVMLDNGERQLMLVRLPIIFSSMALHEEVARRLQEKTGDDWRDSLVISTTHTHSGPARFYHLPEETLVSVGQFGIGAYSQQAFDWLVESTVRAAEDAIEDRAPAAAGTTIVEDFDPKDRIASDRWGQSPAFDDNRMLLLRIEKPDGTPRAVVVSVGMHGTIHEDDYFNGDAPGAVEHGLERALAREYDRPVPVLFFNQNGGTMSPRGGGRGHEGPQRFEKLGHETAERAMPVLRDMETTRQLDLGGETYRFPITYDLLGYESGEWGEESLQTVDNQYVYGGIKCSGEPVDGDYGTHIDKGSLSCLFGLHELLYHRPPTLFLKSQITALTVGDHTLVTLPGEASMEIGWQVARALRDEYGLDPARTWTFGFAQDHQFYLMPTNLRGEKPPYEGFDAPKAPKDYPNFAYSYLQGGYEPGMSFWGWRMGDFIVDRAVDAVGKLQKSDWERTLPEASPKHFTRRDHEPFPVETSDPDRVGTAVEQPPERVERLVPVEFAWVGGDPGAERPQAPRVVLERKEGGTFEPVETDRERPYDNREPVMLTRLRRGEDEQSWVWVVRWEELRAFPTGTYRFRVEGHYEAASGRTSYETTSRTFEVVPNDQLQVGVSTSGTTVRGRLAYPAAEQLEYTNAAGDPGSLAGHYRMRDPRVPTGAEAPLEIGDDLEAGDVTVEVRQNGNTVASASGSEVTLESKTREIEGVSGVPVTRYRASFDSLQSGTYQIEVSVTDAYGNTGSGTATMTK